MIAINLKDTIRKDIKTWERLKDNGFMNYMCLNEYYHSKESGLYQLILNGQELWYGTLQEINAIVKTMICLLERDY